MNQKQLANVLIKILGLSLCAHSISYIAMGITNLVRIASQTIYPVGMRNFDLQMMSLLMDLIPLAIGIYFIIRSRWLTDKLFKDE